MKRVFVIFCLAFGFAFGTVAMTGCGAGENTEHNEGGEHGEDEGTEDAGAEDAGDTHDHGDEGHGEEATEGGDEGADAGEEATEEGTEEEGA